MWLGLCNQHLLRDSVSQGFFAGRSQTISFFVTVKPFVLNSQAFREHPYINVVIFDIEKINNFIENYIQASLLNVDDISTNVMQQQLHVLSLIFYICVQPFI